MQPLGGHRAQDHGGVAGGGVVEEGATRHLAAQGVDQLGVGGPDRDAAGLAGWDPVVAVHAGIDAGGRRHRLHRPHPADHPGGLGGQGGVLAAKGLARGHTQQVGAQEVELSHQVGPAGGRDAEQGDHGGSR